MKSKFDWQFYGCCPGVDSQHYCFTWKTHSSPQFTIEGRINMHGANSFNVYEGANMIEYGWSTLIRAKHFVDNYSVGKAKAIEPFTHHEENVRDSQ